jgi:hypothetical protein
MNGDTGISQKEDLHPRPVTLRKEQQRSDGKSMVTGPG